MRQTFRNRAAAAEAEAGFSMIELIVSLVILAILVAAAIGSYISFRDRGNDTTAKANVRTIVASIESYFADNYTYVGMTPALLATTYDQGIDPARYSIPTTTASSFCVQSSSGGQIWRKNGPSAPLENLACP